jgi:uncharacterized membrane protein
VKAIERNSTGYVQSFLADLRQELVSLPRVKRESYIEELKEHLYEYVEDQRARGLNETEIEGKIKEEFISAELLSKELIEEEVNSRRDFNYSYLFLLLIIPLGGFLFPSYQELLVAIMLFSFSFIVYKKKLLWGFAIVRKNPRKIKDRNKVSQLGSIYLLLLGLLFLFGEFLTFPRKEMVFTACILIFSISFYSYVNKRFVN